MVIFETLYGCHGALILGTSPKNERRHPDMTIAVELDAKQQIRHHMGTLSHAKTLPLSEYIVDGRKYETRDFSFIRDMIRLLIYSDDSEVLVYK